MKKIMYMHLVFLLCVLFCTVGAAQMNHTEPFAIAGESYMDYNAEYGIVYAYTVYSEENPSGANLYMTSTASLTEECIEDGVPAYNTLGGIYYLTSGDILVPQAENGYAESVTRIFSASQARAGMGFYYNSTPKTEAPEEEGNGEESDGTVVTLDEPADCVEIFYGYLKEAAFSEQDIVYTLETVPGSEGAPLCTVTEGSLPASIALIDVTDYEAKVSYHESFADAGVVAGNAWVINNATQENGYGYYLYAKRVNGIVTGAAVYKVDCSSFIANIERESLVAGMGYCGEALTWTLTHDGVLTVRGTGDMDATMLGWRGSLDKILSVVIEDGVTSVADNAFSGAALRSVQIGRNVCRIGAGAFFNCGLLETLDIPAAVSEIGEEAFLGTVSLKALRVAKDNRLFLTENHILYSKDKSVLYYVSAAYTEATYTIPSSVKEIKTGALADAVSIEAFLSQNDNFAVTDGVLYTKGMKIILRYPAAKSQERYTLSASTTEIAPYAFKCATYLRALETANVTKTIGKQAFLECSALRAVSLASNVVFYGNTFEQSGILLVDYQGNASSWNAIETKDETGILEDAWVRTSESLTLPVFCAGIITQTHGAELGASPYWILSDNGKNEKINIENVKTTDVGKLCLVVFKADGTADKVFYPTVLSKTYMAQARGIQLTEQADGLLLQYNYILEENGNAVYSAHTVLVPQDAMFFVNGDMYSASAAKEAFLAAKENFGHITIYESRGSVYAVSILCPVKRGIVERLEKNSLVYTMDIYNDNGKESVVFDTSRKNLFFIYNNEEVAVGSLEPGMTATVVENDAAVWVYLSNWRYNGASTAQSTFDGLAYMFDEGTYATYYYNCNMTSDEKSTFYVDAFGVICYQGSVSKDEYFGLVFDASFEGFEILDTKGIWRTIAFADTVTVYYQNAYTEYTSVQDMLLGLSVQTGGIMSYTEEDGFSGKDVILYSLSPDKKIESFTLGVSSAYSDKYLRKEEVNGVWDMQSMTLGSAVLSASASIFGVVGDGSQKADYILLSKKDLIDGELYHTNGYIYGYTMGDTYACALIYLHENTPIHSFDGEIFDVFWSGAENTQIRFISAQYDADGRMLTVKSEDKTLVQGSNLLAVPSNAETMAYIKAYFWNETQNPITAALDVLKR